MRRILPLAAAAAALAAGCRDAATLPEQAPAASPRAAVTPVYRPGAVSLLDAKYLQVRRDSGDWAPALRAAVRDAGQVYLPPETTYVFRTPVELPSGTRVHGAAAGCTGAAATGHSRILWQHTRSPIPRHGHYWPALVARGTGAAPVTSIGVEGIHFVGSHREEIGLRVLTGREVTFRCNVAERMALVEVTAHFDTIRGTRENHQTTYRRAGETGDAALSSSAIVEHNRGTGWAGGAFDGISGIYVAYAQNVTVANNVLSSYREGVSVMAGDGATSDGEWDKPKYVRWVSVHGNTVTTTVNGVWVSMGEDVAFTDNVVSNCYDVCLDAEGSRRITFRGNTARNGKNIVSAFFRSTDLLYEGNTIIQDSIDDMFSTSTWTDDLPSGWRGPTITLRQNTFDYRGPRSGRIYKGPTERFYFTGNTLKNTVLDLSGLHRNANKVFESIHMGAVSVTGNVLTFTRYLAADSALYLGRIPPAIAVGSTHGPGYEPAPTIVNLIEGSFHAYVAGNQVRSTHRQAGDGIWAIQLASGPQTRIDRNTVQDWSASSIALEVDRSVNATANPSFFVKSNTLSAGVLKRTSPISTTVMFTSSIGNTYITPAPPPPDEDPPCGGMIAC